MQHFLKFFKTSLNDVHGITFHNTCVNECILRSLTTKQQVKNRQRNFKNFKKKGLFWQCSVWSCQGGCFLVENVWLYTLKEFLFITFL